MRNDIPTRNEIEARYPRLIRSLRWMCCLTTDEAVSVVWDTKAGLRAIGGGEAVQHYGGIDRCLTAAASASARDCARRFMGA